MAEALFESNWSATKEGSTRRFAAIQKEHYGCDSRTQNQLQEALESRKRYNERKHCPFKQGQCYLIRRVMPSDCQRITWCCNQ